MKNLILLLFLTLAITAGFSQTTMRRNMPGAYSIGAGALPDPDTSTLQLNGVTSGFLLNRLTTAERDAIVTMVAGLEIYNSTLNKLQVWDGSAWITSGLFASFGTGTDNHVMRWDGTGAAAAQDSGVIISDTDTITGVVDIDTVDMNISGITASRPMKTDATGNVTSALIDLADPTNDVTGVLPIANGGNNSSAALTSDLIMRSNGTNVIESSVVLDAAGSISAVTELQVDNININGDTITNTVTDNPLIIDASGEGEVDLIAPVNVLHVATAADEYSLEIETNASGFGDVKALDIDYITGAIVDGQDEEVILINIDESLATGGDVSAIEVLATTGSANIFGLFAGINVAPIEQISGTFGDMDSALVEATDRLTEFTTASNIEMFTSDNDTITIGDAAKFQEVEFILATFSSKNIQATWEFSTGSGTWTAFTPADGTNGFQNTGVIAWLDADIPTWAVGTGSEYLIRITRTRNGSITSPIEELVQIGQGVMYSWDNQGDVVINDINAAGVNVSDLTANLPVLTDGSKNLVTAEIDLANVVTGVLPIANGGTNSSSALSSNLVMTSVGGAIVENASVSVTELEYLDGQDQEIGTADTVTFANEIITDLFTAARIQVSSTTYGSKAYPDMTLAQRNAIGVPLVGHGVFNTTDESLDVYTGSEWKQIGGGAGGSRLNLIIDNSFEKGVTEGTCTTCTATQETTLIELTDTNTGALKIALSASVGDYEDTTTTSSQYTGVVGLASARIKTDQEGVQFCVIVDGAESACTDVRSDDIWDTYSLNATMSSTSFGYLVKATTSITGNIYVDEVFAGSNPIDTVVTQGKTDSFQTHAVSGFWAADTSTSEFDESLLGADPISGITLANSTLVEIVNSASIDRIVAKQNISLTVTITGLCDALAEVQVRSSNGGILNGSAQSIAANYSNASATVNLAEGQWVYVLNTNPSGATKIGAITISATPQQNKAVIIAVDDDSMTDWVAYTPTFSAGFGTVTAIGMRWRKNGSNLEVLGDFTTGTVAASKATMSLPNSVVIDTDGDTAPMYVGAFSRPNYNKDMFSVLATDGDTVIHFGANLTGAQNQLAEGNGNGIANSSQRMTVQFSVPIVGWSARSKALATVPVEEYKEILVVAQVTGTETMTNNAGTIIDYASELNDSHDAWATNTFTSPRAGNCTVTASASFGSLAWSAGEEMDLWLQKNGVNFKRLDILEFTGTGTFAQQIHGAGTVPLLTGDTLKVNFFHNQGANQNLGTGIASSIEIKCTPPKLGVFIGNVSPTSETQIQLAADLKGTTSSWATPNAAFKVDVVAGGRYKINLKGLNEVLSSSAVTGNMLTIEYAFASSTTSGVGFIGEQLVLHSHAYASTNFNYEFVDWTTESIYEPSVSGSVYIQIRKRGFSGSPTITNFGLRSESGSGNGYDPILTATRIW